MKQSSIENNLLLKINHTQYTGDGSCYNKTPQTSTTTSTPSLKTALVDDAKSSWASTPTQPRTHNIKEVVVNKHAALTTTSEQKPASTASQPTFKKLL